MAKKRKFIGGVPEMEQINKMVLNGYIIIAVVLFLAYLLELIKGSRGIGYFLVFSAVLLVPLIISALFTLKELESKSARYVIGIGYLIMYFFVIFTSDSAFAFAYIVPMVVVFTLYSDVRFLSLVNVISVVVNLISLGIAGNANGWEADFIRDGEIRIAVLILVGIFSVMAGKVTADVNVQKLDRLNREKGMATNVLEQMLTASKEIIANIDQVNVNMNRLGESVKNTRDSMEEVSAGSSDTAETVQTQLEMTEQIQKYIETVEGVSDAVQSNVNVADDVIGHGKKNMNQMMYQAGQSQKAAKEVVKELSDLTGHIDEMQSIVEMIENITSETSLLSLNASIEAARAGEAGKGFAVVASEISKLADQTSSATVNITELIRNIGIALQEVVEATNTLVESNDLQNQYAEETAKDFGAISDKTDDISSLSGRLSSTVQELANANAAIVDSVQNISAITEEVSAHATETFDESEVNLNIVKEVRELVEQLAAQAQNLSNE